MAYSSLGKYERAIVAYNRAVKLKPDYAAAYLNLGHAYSNLKRYDKAIWALRKAIHYEPDNMEAYMALGNAYFDSGRELKAFDTFEVAIQRKPDNPYSYYGLGLLYLPTGLHARALDAFTQAISRDPRYADAYFHRAYTYLYLGRGESAAADAETYIALKGWHGEHSLDMAIVAHLGYLQARQQAAALRIVKDGVREGDAQAWPYLAVEYLAGVISARVFVGLAQGEAQKVEARAYVGAKLSLEGDHKVALDHLKWVRKHSLAWTVPFALAVTQMERIKANSSIASKF
jgi:tetratricopeptide (TPR) repeat protein